MSSAILDVVGLRAGYGHSTVVRGIDLRVEPGEAIALLGPNGHGKTTALSAITGLVKATGGTVSFRGGDITRHSATSIVRAGITHVPQGDRLFSGLTVRENLLLAGRQPRAKRQRAESLEFVHELFPKVLARRGQLVGTLSGGERQMVAIGMGLMACPDLLILDEPTLGLAPKVRAEIQLALERVRARGLSLIVADGDVDFLFAVTDRWYLIELGRVVREDTSANRPSEEAVMEMFIGDVPGGPAEDDRA